MRIRKAPTHGLLNNLILQSADFFNFHFHHISRFQKHRRISKHSDPVGSPGENKIPGFQGDGLGNKGHQRVAIENQIPGIGGLLEIAIQAQFDIEMVGILKLIFRYQKRTTRSEGVT